MNGNTLLTQGRHINEMTSDWDPNTLDPDCHDLSSYELCVKPSLKLDQRHPQGFRQPVSGSMSIPSSSED
jgi:hypothetical protein